MNSEMKKVWRDVRKQNFGIFDQETRKRINPDTLAFFWKYDGDKKAIKEELALHRDLIIIEKIYEKKFGEDNPMDLKLLNTNPEKFVERLIRAVEICTMKYVLNKGGALNKMDCNIRKNHREFLWG